MDLANASNFKTFHHDQSEPLLEIPMPQSHANNLSNQKLRTGLGGGGPGNQTQCNFNSSQAIV